VDLEQLHPEGRPAWLGLVVRWGFILLLLVAVVLFMTNMPRRSYSGRFQSLSSEEAVIRNHLRQHVSKLAGQIGERNLVRYEALKDAARYIKTILAAEGLEVNEQPLIVANRTVENIEVEIGGRVLPEQILIVGAHYDSVVGSPGANDNATGTAALLELVRVLKTRSLKRTIRFVAFVNEEPPYFQTESMGSRVYARRTRERKENVVGMISVETIGHYSEHSGSQRYPLGFSLLYPRTANFIAFVGNVSSRRLVRRSIQSFRRATAFPSEGAAVPGWVTGVGWSDHWSFWQEGYPAIMVTDTALFRYPHYHAPTDTPDRIDYDRTSRVVSGLVEVIADLADTDE
jgi:Zn-dependent M28 family amino/carboxypeptidase